MIDTASARGLRHEAPSAGTSPDLSRLPAYVEPPRGPPVKPVQPSRHAALALTGAASATVLLFGWYVYADAPAASMAMPPPPALPAPVSPGDVPLPDGAQYPASPVPVMPTPAGHPVRLPHPAAKPAGLGRPLVRSGNRPG